MTPVVNKDINQSINKDIDKEAVFLRQATLDDVSALEQLLNLCYRQDKGWTNEADLVSGIRTTQGELAAVIDDPKHYFFIYPNTSTGTRQGAETGELLGCIAVQIKADSDVQARAYIGMFAVHPKLQGKGVGNVILAAAETFATRHLASDKQTVNQTSRLTMSILNHRPELLAYYQRRGYGLTGHSEPFPYDGNNGEPKRQDLALLELEKRV